MQVTTTFHIDGYEVAEYKGMVRGIVVRSPTIAPAAIPMTRVARRATKSMS